MKELLDDSIEHSPTRSNFIDLLSEQHLNGMDLTEVRQELERLDLSSKEVSDSLRIISNYKIRRAGNGGKYQSLRSITIWGIIIVVSAITFLIVTKVYLLSNFTGIGAALTILGAYSIGSAAYRK